MEGLFLDLVLLGWVIEGFSHLLKGVGEDATQSGFHVFTLVLLDSSKHVMGSVVEVVLESESAVDEVRNKCSLLN